MQRNNEMTKRFSWDFYICIGLAVVAAVFIFYRIFSVNLVGDEWGMWKDSIKPGLEALITFQHKDPQSHFLQGLCAIPCLKYLPVDTITAIRIPSFLMFFVYVWAGLHLTKWFKNSWFKILFFAVWIGPQIILEYFGLARGYAFLLAWSGASFVGLIEAYNPENSVAVQNRWTKFSIFSAALAILALLTFSYGYFVITLLLLFRYYLAASGKFWKRILETVRNGSFIIWTSIITGIFYLPRYLVLRHSPAMQWGGTSNYISDTFTSVMGCFTYIHWSNIDIIFWIVFITVLLCLLNLMILTWKLFTEHKPISETMQSPLVLSAAVFFGIAAVTQILFWVLDMQFPIRRAMLYLWPAIVLYIGFSIQENKNWIIRALNISWLIGMLGFAVVSYNTYKGYEYRQDAQNKEITQVICELAKDKAYENRPLVIGMTDCLKYTIWYYLENEYNMPVHQIFKDHPIFQLHGNKLFTYSLNYGYPSPFPPIWHHPSFSPNYYLLSQCEAGNKPNPGLMYMVPVKVFEKTDAALYKAKTPEVPLGCNVNNCKICQMLDQLFVKPDSN